MDEFLEWIKNYIKTQFEEYSELPKTKVVEIYNAYEPGHEVSANTVPEIQVQILDNSEVVRYSSFEGENVTYIPLQITTYTGQMKMGSVMKSPQEWSIKFGEKLKTILNSLRNRVVNKNILSVQIVGMSPALPLLEGKVYTTAVRCRFWIANPYVVGEEPQND